ncbi:MAG TPA: hypothetical protein PK102_04435 [bacterium]|nr:hypothetical protein [bacterium]
MRILKIMSKFLVFVAVFLFSSCGTTKMLTAGFENGKAKVSKDCKTSIENEHIIWESEKWFYIDKKGRKTK